MKFYNLDEFVISKKDLRNNEVKIASKIHLKYPEFKKWLKFPPKKRKTKIKAELKKNYAQLQKAILDKKYKLIGKKSEPRGIIINSTFKELKEISKLEIIDSIFVIDIKGFKMKKLKSSERKRYFSVKARIAIQIEGIVKGNQLYEDRILIIKAKSYNSAQKKLRKEFKFYEEPYLNSDGRLVRWKFEKFIDCFDTDVYDSKEFKGKLGKEVFSVIKERKLKPSLKWKRTWKKK